jgi:hypothetical protein
MHLYDETDLVRNVASQAVTAPIRTAGDVVHAALPDLIHDESGMEPVMRVTAAIPEALMKEVKACLEEVAQ